MELLEQRMNDHSLYAMAVSEIRLDGQGELNCGDGYVLLYIGIGAHGGVGVLLSPRAAEEWHSAGSRYWCSPCARVLMCTLPLAGGGWWHIVSVYGPTLKATEAAKTAFWASLDTALKRIPCRDVLLIAGDSNCRVGSRRGAADPYASAIGPFGVGARNTAGGACSTSAYNIVLSFETPSFSIHCPRGRRGLIRASAT